jgi:uncharacterized protein (DUF1684 family)
MKYITCILLVSFLSVKSRAQLSYADSLLEYQSAYKKDLYPIIKNDTSFIRFYKIDEDFRVTASVEILPHQHFFSMPTSGGKSREAIRYALVKFQLGEKEYRLYAYQLSFLLGTEKHRDDFFIPFTDATSGTTSYDGGRYLDFVTGDILPDQTLLIDFNRAYNPYCAFTSGYNCPLPPKENNLPAAVTAGEMNFGKAKH